MAPSFFQNKTRSVDTARWALDPRYGNFITHWEVWGDFQVTAQMLQLVGDLELTWQYLLSEFHSEKVMVQLNSSFHYRPQWQPIWLCHHIALIAILLARLINSNQPPLLPVYFIKDNWKSFFRSPLCPPSLLCWPLWRCEWSCECHCELDTEWWRQCWFLPHQHYHQCSPDSIWRTSEHHHYQCHTTWTY